MRRPKDVRHALSCDEKIICDNPPVAAPPDGLGAHDRAAVLAPQFSQLRKPCGERLRQGIVGIVPKAPHPPIGVRRRFYISRLSSKTAKRGDMFIADLPRRQRFGEAVVVELWIGTDRGIDRTSTTRSTPDSRSRSTNLAIVLVEWPMVKNVFVSAPVTWRTRSIAKAHRRIMVKTHCFNQGFRRMVDARSSVCIARGSEARHPAWKSS